MLPVIIVLGNFFKVVSCHLNIAQILCQRIVPGLSVLGVEEGPFAISFKPHYGVVTTKWAAIVIIMQKDSNIFQYLIKH